jgi:hypothetical protein
LRHQRDSGNHETIARQNSPGSRIALLRLRTRLPTAPRAVPYT